MTAEQLRAYLAGQWVPVRPNGSLTWRVRRQVRGEIEDAAQTFLTEEGAQKWAEKLNGKGDTTT